MDAPASPFVQGQLSKKPALATIRTVCGCCGLAMALQTDGHHYHRVLEGGDEPLVFVPMLDLRRWNEPSIIDGF